MKIKLLCCDVDGTMTDGSIFVDQNGVESKRFDCRDGAGFHRLKVACPDIIIAMITSEKGGVNMQRFAKFHALGTVKYFYDDIHGVGKLSAISEICAKNGINMSEVAFIGDDLNDLEALENVGFPFCPSNAEIHLQVLCGKTEHGGFLVGYPGGHGAVRRCCEKIVNLNNRRCCNCDGFEILEDGTTECWNGNKFGPNDVCPQFTPRDKKNQTVFKDIKLKKPEEKEFEYHERHHDLFTVISGSVEIHIGSNGFVSRKDYNKDKDFGTCMPLEYKIKKLYQGESIRVSAGTPHKPGLICDHETATIKLEKLEV